MVVLTITMIIPNPIRRIQTAVPSPMLLLPPTLESFANMIGVFLFGRHPMEVFVGMDDAINTTYDLSFDPRLLFTDTSSMTLIDTPV